MRGSDDVFEAEIDKQVELAIDEADAIIFVVDVNESNNSSDKEIAKLLRKTDKQVIVAVNKADKNNWIGFCQKRRYFINTEKTYLVNQSNLGNFLFDEAPLEWENYDVLICKPLNVSGVKKMKIFKRGFKNLVKDPSILFNKKKQNLYLHFDMHHGYGNLKKAIDLLDEKNKDDFLNFMKNNNSFNPHIMFISKPEIIKKWFNNLFPWLKACEQKFEFKNLVGYDTRRLFAYLSERYLSYWFKKNYRFKEINWVQLDNF